MYKIMIVEDDLTIASVLSRHLEKWSYQVQTVTDFGTVLKQFQDSQPHLVLLDISLPFFNGYHWCTEIRKISQAPIIFISSAKDNMSLVMAINLGADDFIAKPFDLDIVTAKVQAVLRRAYSFGADFNIVEHKGMVFNLGDATISYQGQQVELTKNEFKIMQVLLENRGNTVPREHLMQKLWETESFIDDNTLTVNMTRLRKKLEGIGLDHLIHTKKGMGYLVEA